jgi:hypothetical protein
MSVGQQKLTFFISVHDILANENTIDCAMLELPSFLDESLTIDIQARAGHLLPYYPQISDSHFIFFFKVGTKTAIVLWDLRVRLPSKGGFLHPKYILLTHVSPKNRTIVYEAGFIVVCHGSEEATKVFDVRDSPVFSGEVLPIEPFDLPARGVGIKTSLCGRLVAQVSYHTKGLVICDMIAKKELCRLPSCTDASFIDSTRLLLCDGGAVFHIDLLSTQQDDEVQHPSLQLGILSGNLAFHAHGRAPREVGLVAVSAFQLENTLCTMLGATDLSELHLIWILIEFVFAVAVLFHSFSFLTIDLREQ